MARAMKDSGIEWIGSIPDAWEVKRIKYVAEIMPQCVKKGITHETEIEYAPMECIKNGYFIPRTALYGELPSSLTPFNEGDIVIAKVTPCFENGNIAIMSRIQSGFGLGSSELFVLRAQSIYSKYLFYWLRNDLFIQRATATMTGMGGLKRVSASFIENDAILLPPSNVQLLISSFLDRRCAEIDALMADIQAQIETLEQYKRSVITEAVTKGLNPNVPMKDSKIQWIGQMPVHWALVRGKYALSYLQKPIRSDDGVVTCFRDGEVTLRSNRREEGFTMADKEIGYQGVDIGDLVVHGMDGFAGAIGISDSRGKASPVLNVLDTAQNKKYIMYFLRSMAYNDVFLALATGIRVRSCDLRWNKLSELYYPIPPRQEQDEIVNFIDSVIDRTNAIIDGKRQQLAVLEEYKKSVIFEYVTGKKEVPVA